MSTMSPSSSSSSSSSSLSSTSTSDKPHQLVACMASLGIFVVGVLVGRGSRGGGRGNRQRPEQQAADNEIQRRSASVTAQLTTTQTASLSPSVVNRNISASSNYNNNTTNNNNNINNNSATHNHQSPTVVGSALASGTRRRTTTPQVLNENTGRTLTIINGVDVTQAVLQARLDSEALMADDQVNETIRTYSANADPELYICTTNRLVRARNMGRELAEQLEHGMNLMRLHTLNYTSVTSRDPPPPPFSSPSSSSSPPNTHIDSDDANKSAQSEPSSSSAAAAAAAATNALPNTVSTTSLDCPICYTEVILPRVATCGHTICTSCLLSLCEHERRPACPVCRRRFRPPIERMPINFTVKAFVEEQVVARGEQALEQYRAAEAAVLPFLESPAAYRRALDNNNNNNNNNGGGNGNGGAGAGGGNGTSLASRLRPAWNWFKWTVIIVTEFGAFVVSLKELLDSNQPARNRRYQRIV